MNTLHIPTKEDLDNGVYAEDGRANFIRRFVLDMMKAEGSTSVDIKRLAEVARKLWEESVK